MILHSLDKTITQGEIRNAAAKAVFKSLASYFQVPEVIVEKALKDLFKRPKSVRETAELFGLSIDAYEIND